MQKWKHWVNRAQAHLMRLLAPKTLHIGNERPVISFTFDDVPESALSNGAAILEKYGQRGTFYLAGSLTGLTEPHRQLITEGGIRELAGRGHEIGCHSFAHENTASLNGADLEKDIARNRSFLQRVLGRQVCGEATKLNFAYPYNAVSYFARRRLAQSYRTCRAGENRINRGAVSPQMLYGMEIGQPDAQHVLWLKRQIDNVKAQAGWLIFFTHDISDTPTPYGCTLSDFEELVKYAVDSGCAVLTVNEAMDGYSPSPLA